MQVSPAELELTLLEHPNVNDAAVVGIKRYEFLCNIFCTVNAYSIPRPDGEYPLGFVVRKSGTVTARELQELIESRFAPHKWLTAGVQFVDSIPRTASGKIIRRALRDSGLKAKL